jgi:gliding motility-associated-like protein
MAKIISLIVNVFIYSILSNSCILANNSFNIHENENLATTPPIVTTPVYICQNSIASPLIALFLTGATQNWYLTNAPNEIPTSIPPSPNTSIVGSKTYYVSQTIASIESIRVPIVVSVVADKGEAISFIPCIIRSSSIYFDWANILGHPNNAYNYSYIIQGGEPITGNANNSSVEIFNLLPGQSVTLTITSVFGFPCVPVKSQTCSLPCATSLAPTIPPIALSYCLNETPPSLPNPSNISIITGTWNPPTISTSTVGATNYVFIPDPILYPCVSTKTLTITVKQVIIPTFTSIPSAVCQNSTALVLPLTSSDASPITGTWNVLNIDTSTVGVFPYTFTADPGQCASTIPITVSVSVVNPPNTLVSLDWTVSDAFYENQIVTAIPNTAGSYIYQLDSGPFQTSPIFENVASGSHSITIKDIYGCNSPLTENNVLVISYPKFFTPNGDGSNDTWNIFELKDQTNSRIYIFDRYGKLVKEISPKGTGWDGNYNGHPMPATDYWFTVDYAEQSSAKKFKSHFSLKK